MIEPTFRVEIPDGTPRTFKLFLGDQDVTKQLRVKELRLALNRDGVRCTLEILLPSFSAGELRPQIEVATLRALAALNGFVLVVPPQAGEEAPRG